MDLTLNTNAEPQTTATSSGETGTTVVGVLKAGNMYGRDAEGNRTAVSEDHPLYEVGVCYDVNGHDVWQNLFFTDTLITKETSRFRGKTVTERSKAQIAVIRNGKDSVLANKGEEYTLNVSQEMYEGKPRVSVSWARPKAGNLTL